MLKFAAQLAARRRHAEDHDDNIGARKCLKLCDASNNPVANGLITKVAVGQLSAINVCAQAQEIVATYGERGADDPVAKFAKMSAAHAHRDVLRMTRDKEFMVEPFEINIPKRKICDHDVEEAVHKVILPTDVFSAVYHRNPELFEKAFVGDYGNRGLEEFWEMQDKDWCNNHPGFNQVGRPLHPCHAIPLGFHADKGSHIKRDRILSMQWGSTMSSLSTFLRLWLFTILEDSRMVKHVSEEAVTLKKCI